MDTTEYKLTAGGLYVHGVVVSSQAKAIKRKDGTGITVLVTHELATQPGVVMFEQWLDPKEHPEVKVEGDKVTAFPQLAQFSTVTFKVLRYRYDKEKLVISQVEPLAPAAKK